MHDFAFHFSTVDLKTKYTIVFKGDCTNSNGRTVSIEYSGADIINNSSIIVPQEILDDLKVQLNNDYDYGSFNAKKVKETFENKKSYFCDYKK